MTKRNPLTIRFHGKDADKIEAAAYKFGITNTEVQLRLNKGTLTAADLEQAYKEFKR